jgi:hypothetical protein
VAQLPVRSRVDRERAEHERAFVDGLRDKLLTCGLEVRAVEMFATPHPARDAVLVSFAAHIVEALNLTSVRWPVHDPPFPAGDVVRAATRDVIAGLPVPRQGTV